MTDTLYLITKEDGTCAIRCGAGLGDMMRIIQLEEGTQHPVRVAYATAEDIEGVKTMCGYIPNGRIQK